MIDTRRVFIAGTIFIILAIFIKHSVFYSKIYLTVSIQGFESNIFQVFYDTGQGFNEADSVKMSVPSRLSTRRLPEEAIRRFVPNYDFDTASLYFPLPGRSLKNIRIDPGHHATTLAVKEICLKNRFKRACWSSDSILDTFRPGRDTRPVGVRDGLLYLEVTGEDPHVYYAKDDFAELYQSFIEIDKNKRNGSYLVALLFCLGLYWVLGLIKKVVLTERPRLKEVLTQPENIFLALGLSFGILTLLITPPFQASDEAVHFARAVHLSQGQLVGDKQGETVGLDIPRNAIVTAAELAIYYGDADGPRGFDNEKIRYFWDSPTEFYEKQFLVLDILYPPLSYLPQAIGIRIGKLLGYSWLQSMYLGRVSALIVWLTCVYFAIRLIPISKWVMALLALSPVTLFQAASLSVDSLTIGLSFLLIALSLRIALEKVTHPVFSILSILALVGLIAFSKQPYIFFVLLFFLVPVAYFGNKKNYFLMLSSGALVIAGVVFFWLYSIKHVYEAFKNSHDTWQHLLLIVQEPLTYLNMLVKTTLVQGGNILESFFGKLGWFDVVETYDLSMPTWLIYFHVLMLFLFSVTDTGRGMHLSLMKKAVIAGTWLAGILVIYTGLYFASTPVHSDVIWGIQGRYFIPMGMLPLLLLYNRKLCVPPLFHAWLTVAYVPFLLVSMLLVIMWSYYF